MPWIVQRADLEGGVDAEVVGRDRGGDEAGGRRPEGHGAHLHPADDLVLQPLVVELDVVAGGEVALGVVVHVHVQPPADQAAGADREVGVESGRLEAAAAAGVEVQKLGRGAAQVLEPLGADLESGHCRRCRGRRTAGRGPGPRAAPRRAYPPCPARGARRSAEAARRWPAAARAESSAGPTALSQAAPTSAGGQARPAGPGAAQNRGRDAASSGGAPRKRSQAAKVVSPWAASAGGDDAGRSARMARARTGLGRRSGEDGEVRLEGAGHREYTGRVEGSQLVTRLETSTPRAPARPLPAPAVPPAAALRLRGDDQHHAAQPGRPPVRGAGRQGTALVGDRRGVPAVPARSSSP